MTLSDLEQRAERAVRRGELLVALEHFDAYLAQEPDDERVRQRMESVRALLQPSELVSRRRAEPEEPERSGSPVSDAEKGEMHASSGRFDEAAACYGKAVEQNPKNELLRERLEELRKLAKPGARANLAGAGAEKLEAATTAQARVMPAGRSAKASEASFAPLPPPRELPKDPVALLRELLERVRAARRSA
jgi:tetratricopeptide (TPR) repeat protein